MFQLSAQVRFTCFQATDAVARLAGLQGPGMTEGEASLDDLKGHIADALSFVEGAPAVAFDGAEAREIRLELQGGLVFEMTGAQFVRDWALPRSTSTP